MKGIFYNSQSAICSIYESGKMVYEALSKSDRYQLDYTEDNNFRNDYDFFVVNQHVTVNNWITPSMAQSFKGIKFCVVTEVNHNGNPIGNIPGYFDYYIVLDPTIIDTDNVFGFPRPIEQSEISEYVDRGFPIVGSFGFATSGKDWHKIVEYVQQEFDDALIRINIPHATYVQNNEDQINIIRERCKQVISKPGIKLELTSDYMDKEALIRWCSENTLNCFMYNRSDSQPTGLAAVTDQAISSRRPLLTTRDKTFRHILQYIKPFPEIGFREAIANNDSIEQMYNDWSQTNFHNKFFNILTRK